MSPDERTRPAWKVLLVDDEPAVHDASRLILDGLEFEGRGVELLSAGSAAEARELLARHADVALVLLDVVMETDDAGIALVRHIREQRRDDDIQIVLRTGQPGMAPERDVVLRYEINGYFLKTDITSQRLCSIVISALRSHRHLRALRSGEAGGTSPGAAATAVVDAALARELAHADADDVLLLQAQPEVMLDSNRVTGIELVPQWKTAQGLMNAARLGEALPEGPVRRALARALLARACYWARSWQASLGAPVGVSLPLIGECLADCGMPEAIAAAVQEAGLARGTLDLLVSEATLLSGHPDVRTAVTALREAGVTFTLADFGARTISLHRLSQLVPDRLKIHRLFVRGVAGDPERKALTRSLIALAQALNIAAIADGIVSDADAQYFKWEGCDLGQGDALAPACAPADVAEFLRHGARTPH